VHIFIDESGVFLPSAERPGISVVGALVIPEERRERIWRMYSALRNSLRKERGEVKGKLLKEGDFEAVIDLLRRNEALLNLVAIDLNMHESADIAAHRCDMAECFTRGLTSAHHPSQHAYANDLAMKLGALNDQLYVQSIAMIQLVWNTLEEALGYYSQRRPRELGEFRWSIDAKGDEGQTDWERLWAEIVSPILQAKSVETPQLLVQEGDYSHMQRFSRDRPTWLPRPLASSEQVMNVGMILTEHFRYVRGFEPGLELVDIAVSAARRALVGSLGPAGWAGLPRLMIHRPRQYIELVKLHNRPIKGPMGYERVMRVFRSGGRSMLAPRYQE
jgi:hypothetical protein